MSAFRSRECGSKSSELLSIVPWEVERLPILVPYGRASQLFEDPITIGTVVMRDDISTKDVNIDDP